MTYKQLLALLAEKSKFGDFETQGLYRGLHGFFSQTPKPKGHRGGIRKLPKQTAPTDKTGAMDEHYTDLITSMGGNIEEMNSLGLNYKEYIDRLDPTYWDKYAEEQREKLADIGPITQQPQPPPPQPRPMSDYEEKQASKMSALKEYRKNPQPRVPYRPGPVTQPRDLSGYVGLQQDHPAQLNRLQEQKAQTRNTRLDQFKRRVF